MSAPQNETSAPVAETSTAPVTNTGNGITIVPGEKPKIQLIWLDKSRASRITWLLEELGLEYEIEGYKRTSAHLAPRDLKKYHPLGKAPVVIINGVTFAESGNIVEFLIDNFGEHLRPAVKHSQAELDYRYFMHYTEGSLMPFLVMLLVANTIRSAPVPFFIRPITNRISDKLTSGFVGPNVESNFAFLENHMKSSQSGYFAGDSLSGADIMMYFPLKMASIREASGGGEAVLTKEKYPSLWAYVERIDERPAFKKSEERVNKILANL